MQSKTNLAPALTNISNASSATLAVLEDKTEALVYPTKVRRLGN
jgi:hypothetical protein